VFDACTYKIIPLNKFITAESKHEDFKFSCIFPNNLVTRWSI
jgi:hypothetical protein